MAVIQNEEDFDAAMKEMLALWDTAQPGSPEEARLVALSLEIETYDHIHHPVPPPTPEGSEMFRIEQEGVETYDQFVRYAQLFHKERPVLRVGQAYMCALGVVRPDVQRQIDYTSFDAFYDDKRLDAFLQRVKFLLLKPMEIAANE